MQKSTICAEIVKEHHSLSLVLSERPFGVNIEFCRPKIMHYVSNNRQWWLHRHLAPALAKSHAFRRILVRSSKFCIRFDMV